MTTQRNHQYFVTFFNRIHIFFFVFLCSLFIGDGIQRGNDVFWAICTLSTIPLWEGILAKRTYAYTHSILYGVLSISFITSAVLSWDSGYSLSTLMRFITAYIWCTRFATITKDERDHIINGIIMTVITVSTVGLYVFLVPTVRPILPLFSVFGTPSGHFPFVYITLPFLPILFTHMYQSKTIRSYIASGIALISVILSFSRLALVAMAMYTGWHAWKYRKRRYALTIAIGSMLLASVILFFMYWVNTVPSLRQTIVPHILEPYVIKNPLAIEPRLRFIQEGFEGLRRSPFFGTGPGTFSLVSKQFASTIHDISDYSHALWLSLLTETGTIGSVLVFILLATTIHFHKTKHIPIQADYIAALALLFGLSCAQSSIDHYPVLILGAIFIGASGMLVVHKSPKPSRLRIGLLCLLGLYTISWIGSDFATFNNQFTLAYMLAPYRESKTIQLLQSSRDISPRLVQSVYLFHPHNGTISLVLAKHTQDFSLWKTRMGKAMRESPSDRSIQSEYLLGIATHSSPTDSCEAIRMLIHIESLPCMQAPVISFFQSNIYPSMIPLWNNPVGPSRFLYVLGLQLLRDKDAVPIAISLWTTARDLAPQWGFFHIELASLVATYNDQPSAAIPTFVSCLSSPSESAREACQMYIDGRLKLLPPGSQYNEIMAIPMLLPSK